MHHFEICPCVCPGNNTAVGTTTQQCGSSHSSGYNRWVLFQSVCVYTVSVTRLPPFKKQPPRWTQSNSWMLTKGCQKSQNFTPLSNIIFNLTTHIRCFCTCCTGNILKMDMAQENVDKLLMLPDRACDMEQTPAALKQHNVLKNFLNTVCVMWLHIVVFFPIHGLRIQHICWVQRRIYLPLSRGAQWSVVRVRQPLLLLLELASRYRPARSWFDPPAFAAQQTNRCCMAVETRRKTREHVPSTQARHKSLSLGQ